MNTHKYEYLGLTGSLIGSSAGLLSMVFGFSLLMFVSITIVILSLLLLIAILFSKSNKEMDRFIVRE